jgi:hypothetical protein
MRWVAKPSLFVTLKSQGDVNGVNFPMQVNDYPQRRYRIVLRSTMGPIDVYLVRYVLIISP